MKKEDLIRYLQNYFSNIEAYEDLPFEIAAILAEGGSEKAFLHILIQRLAILQGLGIEVTRHKEFESLGNHLFSMHLTGKGFNVRILFSFLPNGKPILLLPFYERAGKRKTDYSTYIPVAADRLSKFMEDQQWDRK